MFEEIIQALTQNPVGAFFAEYPLLLAAIFIITAIIIIKLLSRRRRGQKEGRAKGPGGIPGMAAFRKPGEEEKKSVLEEAVRRRETSLPRERLTIRSLKHLEKAWQEGLITEELYRKTRKRLLEE